ncbi:MAG: hydrogenase nickel incorporation protein HypB [Dehalococcoidales bacterium]|jgi:hydrogenase nickel incorporation protein HypB
MTIKVITIAEDILGANEERAQNNRNRLDEQGTLAVNIMASPGAGKTSLILNTIDRLKNKVRMAVIEGDVASTIDAEKVNEKDVAVVQINTAGGCHLDANMIDNALNNLPLEDIDLLLIENVGNLICPVEFALGEHKRVLISSLPEGDDKPHKYPVMFSDVDVVLLNKIDLQPYLDFDIDAFSKTVIGLNPEVKIFPVSCRTGEGLEAWFSWLGTLIKDRKDQK